MEKRFSVNFPMEHFRRRYQDEIMGDKRVLTDTSVITDFFRKTNKINSALWKIREQNECFMSSVTLFELQCGAKTDKHAEDIEKLCK